MTKFILCLVFVIGAKNYVLGQNLVFDSVKVYTEAYYGTDLHLNQSNVMYGGDSVLIIDGAMAERFFNKLNALKKKSTLYNLKKIRRDFTSANINVRAVFVFYSNLKKTIIGISPQPLMFINNLVFEKKDIPLEDIVKSSIELYKNLFPTKEEIINKD